MKSLREGYQHPFDVYFATRMASVAILGHRSVMARGVPYDIPDFSRKEDRDRYRTDELTPYWGPNGEEPTLPCCSHATYVPSEEQKENFRRSLAEAQEEEE